MYLFTSDCVARCSQIYILMVIFMKMKKKKKLKIPIDVSYACFTFHRHVYNVIKYIRYSIIFVFNPIDFIEKATLAGCSSTYGCMEIRLSGK